MQISHALDSFFFELFPSTKGLSEAEIVDFLKDFYSSGVYKPTVTITNKVVSILIDKRKMESEQEDFNNAIRFCEKRDYQKAKPILLKLIKENQTQSEYHRIMGQVLSEEGDQDLALNYLIDALRWDSNNIYALIMTGNIFAKYKSDIDTALAYYNQSLAINPKDYISLNNIGVNLFQLNRLEEAKKFLNKGIEINPDYPNLHYAMAMVAEKEKDRNSALYSFCQVLKKTDKKDDLYQRALNSLVSYSKAWVQDIDGKNAYRKLRVILEQRSGKQIDIIQDDDIFTSAKIEIAENHNRDKHIVKFNSNYEAYEHLIMHELMHLDLILDAREEKNNLLFVSNYDHKAKFKLWIQKDVQKLKSMNLDSKSIDSFVDGIFNGLNLQVYNTPIDLFIETKIYNEYPEIRAYQFLSLYFQVKQSIQAVTDPQIIEIAPKAILSKSKIYSLINALHFKELFGVDLLDAFYAKKTEKEQALNCFKEYKEYEQDKEAGEEYELIQNWAEDLKLDSFFYLINEEQYKKQSNIEELIQSIEQDPYGIEEQDFTKEREHKKFQKSHNQSNVNNAVVMYMVDALQYFRDMSLSNIKKIAYDIAILGTQGFSPDKEGYEVASIKDKTFTGYHILAYYYVSWALALPDMLPELQLPFNKEFEMAKTMHNLNS